MIDQTSVNTDNFSNVFVFGCREDERDSYLMVYVGSLGEDGFRATSQPLAAELGLTHFVRGLQKFLPTCAKTTNFPQARSLQHEVGYRGSRNGYPAQLECVPTAHPLLRYRPAFWSSVKEHLSEFGPSNSSVSEGRSFRSAQLSLSTTTRSLALRRATAVSRCGVSH